MRRRTERGSREGARRGRGRKSEELFVDPELSELGLQGVRQEHVAGMAVLGDLGPEADAVPGPPVGRVDITDVQTYNLGQPEPGAQGQGVDQVVPEIAARGAKNRLLLGVRQGRRAMADTDDGNRRLSAWGLKEDDGMWTGGGG